jgi:hypothetical protein
VFSRQFEKAPDIMPLDDWGRPPLLVSILIKESGTVGICDANQAANPSSSQRA